MYDLDILENSLVDDEDEIVEKKEVLENVQNSSN